MMVKVVRLLLLPLLIVISALSDSFLNDNMTSSLSVGTSTDEVIVLRASLLPLLILMNSFGND